MAYTIAVANQKGGVAKTTSTYNLGVAIALMRKRVLLVDLDAQASLTISAGLEPVEYEDSNIIHALWRKIPTKDCIVNLQKNIDLLPSIIDLANDELLLFKDYMGNKAAWAKLLDKALSDVQNDYDFILIDCPPALSILTINALSCANGVLIPSKADYLSYRGLTYLTDTAESIKRLTNPKLEILGVIITLFDARIKDDKEVLEVTQEEYNVIGIVRKLVAGKKGIYEGKAAVQSDPNSKVSIEYRKIAKFIIKSSQ